jgi:hypothetical protein
MAASRHHSKQGFRSGCTHALQPACRNLYRTRGTGHRSVGWEYRAAPGPCMRLLNSSRAFTSNELNADQSAKHVPNATTEVPLTESCASTARAHSALPCSESELRVCEPASVLRSDTPICPSGTESVSSSATTVASCCSADDPAPCVNRSCNRWRYVEQSGATCTCPKSTYQ